MDEKVAELVSLLPDISKRLASMKPEIILRLIMDIDAVAAKLLQLKRAFPKADCGKMLVRELGLMTESAASLEERAKALREFLPAIEVDLLVQDNPSVLSVDSFKSAVEEARRLMPGVSIERMMMNDPDFVLSLQRGSDMIPYDAIPDNPWGHK